MNTKVGTTKIVTGNGKTVGVRVRPIGQGFGCIGEVVAGNGRVIATTDTKPHGFTSVAYASAVELARRYTGGR